MKCVPLRWLKFYLVLSYSWRITGFQRIFSVLGNSSYSIQVYIFYLNVSDKYDRNIKKIQFHHNYCIQNFDKACLLGVN